MTRREGARMERFKKGLASLAAANNEAGCLPHACAHPRTRKGSRGPRLLAEANPVDASVPTSVALEIVFPDPAAEPKNPAMPII